MVANPGKFQAMLLGSLTNNSNTPFIEANKHMKSTKEVNVWELPLTTTLLLQNT